MPSAEDDSAALAALLARSDATRQLASKIDHFVTAIKRRDFTGSKELTQEALRLTRLLVTVKRWSGPLELLQVIRALGRRLVNARPVELVVGNVIRRVIHTIKDEYFTMLKTEQAALSQGSMGSSAKAAAARRMAAKQRRRDKRPAEAAEEGGEAAAEEAEEEEDEEEEQSESDGLVSSDEELERGPVSAPPPLETVRHALLTRESSGHLTSLDPKESVLPSREIGLHDLVQLKEKAGWSLGREVSSAISEMLSELENTQEPISKQALEHIHSDDVIMVYGVSGTVRQFLQEAAKKRRSFKVIVVEGAPDFKGHRMARSLAELDIPTTLVADSAVFAVMAAVNKVIIGTHAVMANGGLVTEAGTHMVALAAKHHAVPVVCITGLYKLCPLFPYNRDAFIDLKSPGPAASYAALGGISHNVQVVCPSYDYVPPELVSLFVTNTGGHQPSYIYRLLSEMYDINAEEEL